MADPVIKDITDTAFWIAHYRAHETQRPDALFRDPFAAQLAGEEGPRIAKAMPGSSFVEWTVALRTHIIDEFVRNAIAAGADVVLNLGAGLDARPYRLELPATLRWIEADHARIIDYKEKILAPATARCHLERVRIDLAQSAQRQAFLAKVDASANKCLVITEGVIPYLTNTEAGVLADDLHAMKHAQWWILDYFSAEAQRYRRRANLTKVMGDVQFKFAPDDWFAFFGSHGWQSADVRYFVEESMRLNRALPLPPVMKYLWLLKAPF
ncbi:MAG: class I SAM-dependent methyltransferase, partial [Povalibacter sp.]